MSIPVPAQHGLSDVELLVLFDGNPVVNAAEQALRAAGVRERADAAQALTNWHHTPALSRRERAAILARFGGAR